MSKNDNNNIVPKLRFPDFLSEGSWEVDVLSSAVKSESSAVAFNKLQLLSTGYPVYGADGLVGYIDEYDQEDDYIAIVKDGSGVGRLTFYKGQSSVLGTSSYLKSQNTSQYYLPFFYFLLQTIKLKTFVKGSGIPHIYYSDYSKAVIAFPKPKEQQKIAACLSSLDELITAESHKIDALKAHKKGLMRQLFPAEGETVPKLRFEEFRNRGEWVDTTIESNCSLKGRIGYRGYTTEDLVEKGKGALVLGGKHIRNHILDLSEPTFLSWSKYYESPEIIVEVGDIIFSQRGTLGDCAIIDNEIGCATINPSMVLLKNITCNPKFLYYILTGDGIQKEVRKNSTSSAVPMLSQKQIKEFHFYIPSVNEQQKIAECLTSLDEQINQQAEKIESLKLHKKGLMQQLFPNKSGI